MELNQELTMLQGLITSLNTNKGNLSKIKYKGGNEMKINHVSEAVKQFLTTHNYLNNKLEVDASKSDKLNEIITLLLLNTDFLTPDYFDDKKYTHLHKIMPLISPCVLINIIINLNLVPNLLTALNAFPLQLLIEMVNEILTALKMIRSDLVIAHIFPIIASIIERVNGFNMNDTNEREIVMKLNDLIPTLLWMLSGINSSKLEGLTRNIIYRHIGIVLVELLGLLLSCTVEDFAHAKIIDELLKSTIGIMSAVNIDAFIEWAEVKYEEEVLQLCIAERSYKLIEKYSNFKPAKEVLDMLKEIARKPKTLREIIHEASPETIIKMLKKRDENQRQWFTAFLGTGIFDNENSVACLKLFINLCEIRDVDRLLKLGASYEDIEIKKLVIQCAANLNKDDLIIVLSRYFSFVGLKNNYEHRNIQNELLLLLNKINASKCSEDVTVKEILLLFIENPLEVIKILSQECVNNSAYISWLKNVFSDLRVLFSFELAALNTLDDLITENMENPAGLKAFIEMLVETEVCSVAEIIGHSLKTLLHDFFDADNEVDIKFVLSLMKDLEINNKISDDLNSELVYLLVYLLETYRCKFADFDEARIDVVINSVAVLKNLQQIEKPNNALSLSPLNQYYINHDNKKFLDYVYGGFSIENEPEAVAKLLKALSKCVPDEWLMIVNDLSENLGVNKSIELLTMTLILISQVTSQEDTEPARNSMEAFKFYLQCYGISIKKLQDSYKSNDFGMNLIKNICKLIDAIPDDLRYTEGLSLITLFPEEALRLLSKDRNFVYTIARFKEQKLSKIIAQKMLN